ncbi:N-acetylmuramic acid 6-phosphate etherase [Picrophilus oshimae]|uniref:Glucokinase regulatory protein n=1 Tax=Picrophilus torridus (strain ATCC 700027 / DSM 9790 / JCM 10055 / NBRC 100828 / KAW 2/3) TaxID=1122961 RepID=Q6L352_PICTO|nr:N-acetylmuramic acid 6-phosphate etherase [Picrophilus oshimae]AAT42599.1 glucokinase regulatory protein [Picrophilus oshimae DSM 9789]SMD31402.1 N-acetylmuramic acid 6-phosphate etherase [Picrophilus oshimae DSM 9789]
MNDTEDINLNTVDIDTWDFQRIAEFIHLSDISAYEAVGRQIENISRLAEVSCNAIRNGGRVIYIGAGTSGRIAAQDVVELKPTYNLGRESFDYIIAGGERALAESVENSEDDQDAAVKDLKSININKNDVVIGISASGTTPFVISALKFSMNLGCLTAGITCNENREIKKFSNICIELITGAEVIQGSTRMKAGTAQKMALNIISTSIAVKLGRTYKNTMSSMESWYNQKLRSRAVNILMHQFNLKHDDAVNILERTDYDISRSIDIIRSMNKK